MKTLFTLLLAALAFVTLAQPQKINYQAIALGSNGKPLKNTTVSLRLSVLDSAATGTVLYTETQPATTDAGGQFSVYLGTGTPTAGMFASIPWANGNDKFLRVEMDAQGGTNYQVMGTTQLVSVPYSIAAGKANILEDSLGTQFQISYDGNGNPFLKLKLKPIPNCGNAIIYAGESYPTVQIGRQCWFAKNLNVGTMIQGANDQTNNSVLEKYCYNNDPANCTTYGGLYQWAEAVQYQNGAGISTSPSPAFTGNVRGICPTGWHMPSDAEWGTLETFLGGPSVAGGALKSTSGLWTTPNTGATNSSGFSALPGGYRNTGGAFNFVGYSTGFWSSSESSSTSAVYRYLGYNGSSVDRYNSNRNYGFSARCTQD